MVDLENIIYWIGNFMLDILFQISHVQIKFGNLSVNLLYLIFGGLLISAIITFVGKAVAKG